MSRDSDSQPLPRVYETQTGEIQVRRGIALTDENAARAEALVSAYPDKCSLPVPFGEEYPIDLWVRTWVAGQSFKAIAEIMNGTRPLPQPERQPTHEQG